MPWVRKPVKNKRSSASMNDRSKDNSPCRVGAARNKSRIQGESTMTTTTTNGRVRKNLADQIDRLDGILDGLSEALQTVVTQAVQEAVGIAVREAVQAALTEVLTNPAILALLRTTLAPEVMPQAEPVAAATTETQPKASSEQKKRPVRDWVARKWNAMRATCRTVKGWMGRRCAMVCQFWRPLLVACFVGLVAGVLGYVAAPWVTAGLAYLGGFASTLLVQFMVAVRRVFAMPAMSFAGAMPSAAGALPSEGDDTWPVI
jgi:hypothetical protein